MKDDNIMEMHRQFTILVQLMKKDGHAPLAIAGTMLASAMQIYQRELGTDLTLDLFDQIANGDAYSEEVVEDYDDEETRH